MKKYLLIILLGVFLGYISQTIAADAVSGFKSATSFDRIVVVVNDEAITQSELDKQMAIFKKKLTATGVTMPDEEEFQKKVLQQLIDKKIQLQIAKNIGIEVSTQELNETLDHMAQENKMTLKDVYFSAEQDGWSIEEFRNEIQEEITIRQLQEQQVVSRVRVSEQEIDDFLRSNEDNQEMPSYRLADILIALSNAPSPQELEKAKSEALAIVEKLEQGGDFHKIAITESEGMKALQGGDLGWRKLPELPLAFSDHIRAMQVEDVAGPIRTPNGFHVIKLLDVKKAQEHKVVEEAEIQMIFIKYSKSNEKISSKKVDKILKDIKNGKNFGTLARRYSDHATAKVGGYMGWVDSKQFDVSIYEEIDRLNAGEVSRSVLTDKGWYIIKVIAKRQTSQVAESERKEVKQLIFNRKVNEAIHTFIIDLRNEAYIKTY